MSNGFDIHSKACQARAIIAAVENIRDMHTFGPANRERGLTVKEFRTEVARAVEVADGYLADGLMDCVCHVGAIQHVLDTLAPSPGDLPTDAKYRRDEAQRLAEEYLSSGRLTPQDYIYLVKRSEGRA